MQKLSFVVGAGVGYVLGARSGRSRYDQIVTRAQDVAHHPAVQSATETATAQAKVAAQKAGATLKVTAAVVQAKAADVLHHDRSPVAEATPMAYPPNGGGVAGAVTPGVPDQHVQ